MTATQRNIVADLDHGLTTNGYFCWSPKMSLQESKSQMNDLKNYYYYSSQSEHQSSRESFLDALQTDHPSTAATVVYQVRSTPRRSDFCRSDFCRSRHLPVATFAGRDICRSRHLPTEILPVATFAGRDICRSRHLPVATFAGRDICRSRHLPVATFAGRDICRSRHLPVGTTNYIDLKPVRGRNI